MSGKICANSPEVSIECPFGYIPCCAVKGTKTHTSCLATSKPTNPRNPNDSGPKFSSRIMINSILEFLESHGTFPSDPKKFEINLKEAIMHSGAILVIGNVKLVFHPNEELKLNIDNNWNQYEIQSTWKNKYDEILKNEYKNLSVLSNVIDIHGKDDTDQMKL